MYYDLTLSNRLPTILHGAVRAGALTTAGLAIGTLLGSALQSWLRVDIVPIGVYFLPLFHETRASPIVLLDTSASMVIEANKGICAGASFACSAGGRVLHSQYVVDGLLPRMKWSACTLSVGLKNCWLVHAHAMCVLQQPRTPVLFVCFGIALLGELLQG